MDRELFSGGGQNYYDVLLNATAAQYVSIIGANTFNSLSIPNSKNISFEGGATQTYGNNGFSMTSGTGCLDFVNLKTTLPGNPATLSMPAGVFPGDWLYIQDVKATGGATWDANNSIGIGDVSGWNIIPIPSVYMSLQVLM
ncbi:unnamed protein product [marine sediment metagenome]|uniref:Uncharacterized protein n=1 Tax=marine sediment metagenome TaxID=412755 RepID=X1R6H2_9ZZZZ